MTKVNEVIFQAPTKGVHDDPFAGSPQVQGLDITNIPGIAQLGLAAVLKSGVLVTGIPMWGVVNNDSVQTVFVVDTNQRVYTSTNASSYATWTLVTHGNDVNANAPSAGNGNGLVIWKNYLVLAGNTLLDFYNLGTLAWLNGASFAGFALQSDTIGHPLFTSLDDRLYIGNGRYVNSIQEAIAPFSPATPASYTATDKLITLPTSYRVRCIDELGANLMIGTFVGSSLTTMIKIARIYPWNRSTTTLGLPIILRESGVHQMISINNELIFQAGTLGRWYVTNGSSSRFLVRLPPYIINNGPTISHPGAITMHKGRIYAGITSLVTSSIIGSNVWSFNTDGTQLVVETATSQGGQSSTVTIGCLIDIGGQVNDLYLVGWQDTNVSLQGIDLIGNDNYKGGYGGEFQTEIKTLGTTLEQKTYTKLEYYLDKKLAVNEGIQISYRTDTGATWTLLGIYSFTSEGAVKSANKSVAITYVDQLQLLVQLTGTTTTPHFKYIRLDN